MRCPHISPNQPKGSAQPQGHLLQCSQAGTYQPSHAGGRQDSSALCPAPPGSCEALAQELLAHWALFHNHVTPSDQHHQPRTIWDVTRYANINTNCLLVNWQLKGLLLPPLDSKLIILQNISSCPSCSFLHFLFSAFLSFVSLFLPLFFSLSHSSFLPHRFYT